MNYHIKKGDMPMSMISTIAEEMGTPVDKLIKLLNSKYIKTKI